MQALTAAMKKTLNDDCFIAALNHIKDEIVRERVGCVAAQMVNELDPNIAQDNPDGSERVKFFEHDFVGQHLKSMYETAVRFFRCVCNLLQRPTQVKLRVEEVTWFLHYRGPDSFNKAIKTLLTMPEPEGENFTRLKQESRALLQELVQDTMRTAATHDGAQGQLEALMKQIGDVQVGVHFRG